jgi:DNA replicative helicase MCM subunit Mcm2 (Cdc46/Mcm family)
MYEHDDIDQELLQISDSRFVDYWADFCLNYIRKDEKTPYYKNYVRMMPLQGLTSFTMDYNDISYAIGMKYDIEFTSIIGHEKVQKWGDFKHLEWLILRDGNRAVNTLGTAVIELLQEIDPKYANSVKYKLRPQFANIPIFKKITELGTDTVGKFIRVMGIVIEYDERKHQYRRLHYWRCQDNHINKTKEGAPPKKCVGEYNEHHDIKTKCDSTDFILDEKLTAIHSDDWLEIKIQERGDVTTSGKMPAEVSIEVMGRENTDYIINDVNFGDVIEISGMCRIPPLHKGSNISLPYVEASHLHVLPDNTLSLKDPRFEELIPATVRPETEERDYFKLVNSVAHSIYTEMRDIMKELILLLCVGSDYVERDDGTRNRGNLQVLIIGDPSTAKSTITDWIQLAMPKAQYVNGNAVSPAGLIGGITQDSKDKDRRKIFPGAFELANKYVLIMDEVDKMKKDLIHATSDPMSENQKLDIQKAGQKKEIPLNLGVLGLANPNTESQRYDISLSFYENVKLPRFFLDRFDVILVRRDIYDEVKDKMILSTISNATLRAVDKKTTFSTKFDTDDYYPISYMNMWLEYVKTHFHPIFDRSDEAKAELHDWYFTYRRKSIRVPKNERERENWSDQMEIPSVDTRRALSFKRIAEAHARACHRNECNREDALVARRIMEIGMISMGIFPEEREKQAHSTLMEHLNKLIAKARDEASRAEALTAKKFYVEVDRLAWENCKKCKKSGQVYDFEFRTMVSCPSCNGKLGWRREFGKEALFDVLIAKGLTDKQIADLWNVATKQHEISAESNTGNWNFNVSHSEFITRDLNLTAKIGQEGDKKSSTMMRLATENPQLFEQISSINDNDIHDFIKTRVERNKDDGGE